MIPNCNRDHCINQKLGYLSFCLFARPSFRTSWKRSFFSVLVICERYTMMLMNIASARASESPFTHNPDPSNWWRFLAAAANSPRGTTAGGTIKAKAVSASISSRRKLMEPELLTQSAEVCDTPTIVGKEHRI